MSRTHTVGDVMTRTVAAVRRTAPFKEIVQASARWRVSAMPVVEEDGRVIGVVSEADMLPKEEYRDAEPSRLEQMRYLQDMLKCGAATAEELMTTPAVTVRPDATLPQAARIMAHHRVKRLPVVDAQGRLKGVISRCDLLKVFLRPDEEIAREVADEVVPRLFPAPCRVDVTVEAGVVTLSGRIPDTSLIPAAARAVRAVEGVVGFECALSPSPAAPPPVARPAVPGGG